MEAFLRPPLRHPTLLLRPTGSVLAVRLHCGVCLEIQMQMRPWLGPLPPTPQQPRLATAPQDLFRRILLLGRSSGVRHNLCAPISRHLALDR